MLLGDQCREILTLFLQKVPHAEIARRMGHNSENYSKKLKHICKERLIKNIQNDPDFKLYHYESND